MVRSAGEGSVPTAIAGVERSVEGFFRGMSTPTDACEASAAEGTARGDNADMETVTINVNQASATEGSAGGGSVIMETAAIDANALLDECGIANLSTDVEMLNPQAYFDGDVGTSNMAAGGAVGIQMLSNMNNKLPIKES